MDYFKRLNIEPTDDVNKIKRAYNQEWGKVLEDYEATKALNEAQELALEYAKNNAGSKVEKVNTDAKIKVPSAKDEPALTIEEKVFNDSSAMETDEVYATISRKKKRRPVQLAGLVAIGIVMIGFVMLRGEFQALQTERIQRQIFNEFITDSERDVTEAAFDEAIETLIRDLRASNDPMRGSNLTFNELLQDSLDFSWRVQVALWQTGWWQLGESVNPLDQLYYERAEIYLSLIEMYRQDLRRLNVPNPTTANFDELERIQETLAWFFESFE